MADKQSSFSLLDLSRELRENVYFQLIPHQQTIHIKRHLDVSDVGVTGLSDMLTTPSPLLLVNKQIHDEYKDALVKEVCSANSEVKVEACITSEVESPADCLVTFYECTRNLNKSNMFNNSRLQITLVQRYETLWDILFYGIQSWVRYADSNGISAKYFVEGTKYSDMKWCDYLTVLRLLDEPRHGQTADAMLAVLNWHVDSCEEIMSKADKRLDRTADAWDKAFRCQQRGHGREVLSETVQREIWRTALEAYTGASQELEKAKDFRDWALGQLKIWRGEGLKL